MVERLDQVLITLLSPVLLSSSIFEYKCESIKGPFLIDLAIIHSISHLALRRRRIHASDFILRLRVLYPLVGLPQGVTG